MRQNGKWKKTGVLLLTAAAVGTAGTAIAAGGMTAMTAFAAQKTAVTEYSEEELVGFQDNTLDYREIPGLIELYNTEYKSKLESFYGNPGGSTGLTKDQMLSLAADLRVEASDLEYEAEEMKDEVPKKVYEGYKANVRSLKAYAKQLEDAAAGKTAAGSAAFRGLRILKNNLTRTGRELMREYQVLSDRNEIAKKNLEAAELTRAGAGRQKELGMYSGEQVLAAEDKLNAARAAATKAEADLKECRQTLITMFGWSYDAEPEILSVPEPDMEKIAGFRLELDTAKAIENNYGLFDIRKTSSKASGGVEAKARKIKDTEEQITTSMDLLYKEVLQKQAAYEAATTLYTAARSDKEAADRRFGLGMMSRQDYLAAESAWLTSEASWKEAGLALTGAMEDYQWAVEGLLDTGASGNAGAGNGGGLG